VSIENNAVVMVSRDPRRQRPNIVRRNSEREDSAAIDVPCHPAEDWITDQTYPVSGGYSVNQ
jgi:hypothetical protein